MFNDKTHEDRAAQEAVKLSLLHGDIFVFLHFVDDFVQHDIESKHDFLFSLT